MSNLKVESKFNTLLFRVHRALICKFFHKQYHKPMPQELSKAYYSWGWYCNKCSYFDTVSLEEVAEVNNSLRRR